MRKWTIVSALPLSLVQLCTSSLLKDQMSGCPGTAEQQLQNPGCWLPSSGYFIVSSTWLECPDMLGRTTPRLLWMAGQFVLCKNATS